MVVPAVPAGAVVAVFSESVAAATWVVMIAVYVAHLVKGAYGFSDLRHPIYGPLAAFIPVIGILVAATFHGLGVPGLESPIVAFALLLLVMDAWLLRTWIVGEFSFDAIHSGYLLPLVAGAFLASFGLSSVGLQALARGAWGIGLFFWFIIGTAVFFRLMLGPQLGDAARPGVAILLSPPATAGIAWFALTDGDVGIVMYLILGVLGMVLLAQMSLISFYLTTPFTLGFWAVTFPVCSSASLLARVVVLRHPPEWEAIAIVIAGLASFVVVSVAVRTAMWFITRRRQATKR